jgi:hypothetical protein
MILTLFLGLITRSFNDNHARIFLKKLTQVFFGLGSTLMNYVFAPFAFLVMASVVSREPSDWGFGDRLLF